VSSQRPKIVLFIELRLTRAVRDMRLVGMFVGSALIKAN